MTPAPAQAAQGLRRSAALARDKLQLAGLEMASVVPARPHLFGGIDIVTRMIGLTICLALMFLASAKGADDASRFDGTWDTTVSCSNAAGALGYSFQFASTVKNGALHGEKGTEGKPGWLQLQGNIRPDGTAKIYAKGLVGAQEYAVGHRPAGTEYGYHIVGKFSDREGTGKRVEGRPCDLTFIKK
jgi:hypothetical protein